MFSGEFTTIYEDGRVVGFRVTQPGGADLASPTPPMTVSEAETVKADGFLDFLRPLKRLKARAVEMAVARGASQVQVEALVEELGDRPLLDWLKDGGLELIVKMILMILAAL